MLSSTKTLFQNVNAELDSLITYSESDTRLATSTGDIPEAVEHFVELRDEVRDLKEKFTKLQNLVDSISEEMIPTLFLNNGRLSSVRIKGIGTVKVSERWSASIVPSMSVTAIQWLKNSNMDGLIKQTVHSQTLGAVAKDAQIAGKPLPSDLFKVSSSSFTSITK